MFYPYRDVALPQKIHEGRIVVARFVGCLGKLLPERLEFRTAVDLSLRRGQLRSLSLDRMEAGNPHDKQERGDDTAAD